MLGRDEWTSRLGKGTALFGSGMEIIRKREESTVRMFGTGTGSGPRLARMLVALQGTCDAVGGRAPPTVIPLENGRHGAPENKKRMGNNTSKWKLSAQPST